MKLLVMQYFPYSYHFLLLRSKYPSQNPVLTHLNLYSSLKVTDQVSRPYKAQVEL